LAGDDVVAFVEGRQQGGIEVDGPDAVVGLFQTDVPIDHGTREVQEPVPKTERAACRDLLHQEVAGVLERR
jgi:hypothetical protein